MPALPTVYAKLAGDVDNRQAAMAEVGMVVMVDAVAVGSAMGDEGGHAGKYAAGAGNGRDGDETRDAAHIP